MVKEWWQKTDNRIFPDFLIQFAKKFLILSHHKCFNSFMHNYYLFGMLASRKIHKCRPKIGRDKMVLHVFFFSFDVNCCQIDHFIVVHLWIDLHQTWFWTICPKIKFVAIDKIIKRVIQFISKSFEFMIHIRKSAKNRIHIHTRIVLS